MAESLGKASLELSADLGPLERDLKIADAIIDKSAEHLKKLERQAELAEKALKNIKMLASQGVETDAAVESMQRTVDGLKDKAAEARLELRDVKLTEDQAVETEVAGHRIESTLDKISRKAGEARRALLGTRLAGAGGGGGGKPISIVGAGGSFGHGVGPFGSGYGRLGLVGTSILSGAIPAPAAGPGALGLLAAIPALASAGAGALGTLALAFAGVGKAIGGDKKAFEALQPAQQAFVLRIRSMKGWLDSLRETAGESLFPGLTKGLDAALSPGLLNAITVAVKQFGEALGGAGEKAGRYFGSAQFQNIFGPLMVEGAHEIGTLTDVVLSLFDALGVLGRAGIPLTRWITDAAASGARLVDTFTRAQDASGGLDSAMTSAQGSLRIVARLGLSLLHVVGALGEALYPVSQVAVKDLTGGLDSLAASIHRNQGQIRDIVGGALGALKTTIVTIVPLLGKMVKGLDGVAKAIGGWKTAFEIIIGGYLATKLLGVADSITKIGLGAGEKGAAGKVGLLRTRLASLARIGSIAVTLDVLVNAKNRSTGQVITEGAIAGFLWGGPVGAGVGAAGALGYKTFQGDATAADATGAGGYIKGTSLEATYLKGLQLARQKKYGQIASLTNPGGTVTVKSGGPLGVTARGLTGKPGIYSSGDYLKAFNAGVTAAGAQYGLVGMNRPEISIPSVVDGNANTDVYGAQPPWTKNLGPKGPKASALDIVFPPRMQSALYNAKANAAGGGMKALEHLLTVAKTSLDYLDKEHRTGKKLVALQRERATIAALIATTEGKIAKAVEKAQLASVAIPQRLKDALANAKSALGLTTSSPDSAASLNARASALAKVVGVETAILDRLKAQHVTGKALALQKKEEGENATARGKALAQLGVTAQHAGIASVAEHILGIGSGPSMSSQVASLRQRERGLLEKVIRKKTGTPEEKLTGLSIGELLSKASPFLSKASSRSLTTIGKAWELYLKQGFLPDSAITNVKTRLAQFNDTIQASFDKLSLSAAQVARKQERAFLETFQAIVSNYAPNAVATRGGATDTHLYDIKHETREQTKTMKKIASRVSGSASDYAHGLGMFG